jgi:hypothetical protein
MRTLIVLSVVLVGCVDGPEPLSSVELEETTCDASVDSQSPDTRPCGIWLGHTRMGAIKRAADPFIPPNIRVGYVEGLSSCSDALTIAASLYYDRYVVKPINEVVDVEEN